MRQPIFLNNISRWVNQLPLRVLEDAYQGAIAIKAIEDKHFGGQKIAPDSERGKSIFDYFESNLNRELTKIRFNLAQFKVSNFFITSPKNTRNINDESPSKYSEADILEKLAFIESVIGKYRSDPDNLPIIKPIGISTPSVQLPENLTEEENENNPWDSFGNSLPSLGSQSIFNIRRKLSSDYEQEVVQQLRYLRQERKIAIRFMALLIVVPIVVQLISRNFIYSPLINWKFVDTVNAEKIQVSEEFVEDFLIEFSKFKEIMEIKGLLGIVPEISPEKERELIRKKAVEMGKEAAYKTLDGWKNILSDLTSLATFTALIYFFRRQFSIMRQFLGHYFSGLNDVTKVFIFILLTDMFVGFHSAEGWDVILSGILKHIGLPESHTFNHLFIATIPVIMDSFFKLLIFNYLTRKSPTAVAILEKMNQ